MNRIQIKLAFAYVLALFVVLFTSCNSDNMVTHECFDSFSQFRTQNEAIAIAESYASLLDSKLCTRSNQDLSVTRKADKNHTYSICNRGTRSNMNSITPLYYIVNYQDSLGFAIISANRNAETVLALTECGYYAPETSSQIDGFNDFMNMLNTYISSVSTTELLPLMPISLADTLWSIHYNLIDTQWQQTGVTGSFCPNGVTGCVPLAVAEILSYYRHPTSIRLSYYGADLTTQNLDWVDINKHVIESATCTATDSAHNALGRLCRQLGEMMNSNYYDDGSTGTYRINVPVCFSALGYSVNNWTDYSSNCCVAPISNNHPLIIAGAAETPDGLAGHEWIVDGFIKRTIISRRYISYGTDTPTWESETEETVYNHINWGWGGMNNGYFFDGIFDTSNYSHLDSTDSTISPSLNFDTNLQYLEVYR